MTRYRALLFGEPLGPWQATHELAEQSAINAGQASRDPATGEVCLSTGAHIEGGDGHIDISLEEMRWADALQIIHEHRHLAVAYAEERLRMVPGDAKERWRWRDIARRIRIVFDAAARDGGKE